MCFNTSARGVKETTGRGHYRQCLPGIICIEAAPYDDQLFCKR